MLHFNLMPVMVLAFLGSTQCSQPSVNDFQIYAQLEEALINYDYNLFVLSQTFYPSTGSGPICIPVKYSLDCENSSYSNSSNSSNSSYSEFFLWTLYDVNKPAGRLLLTQNFIGISLRGFAWEEHCFLHNPIELRLNVCSLNLTEDEPSILHALKEITAVLKGYAKAQGRKLEYGQSDTNGYASRWYEEHEYRLFRVSSAILTAVIVLLNLFIIFLAIALTYYTYDIIYEKIKLNDLPAWYPIFWSVVFLCICWNVGPAWLVLTDYGLRIYYSLAFMVLVELLIAILVKKKSDFPVPLPCHQGCPHHKGKHSSIDLTILKCCSCLLNHFYQVVAICSILVFLTFLAYYAYAVIVAFYLSPVQTLVKVVFLVGMAIFVVFVVALIFDSLSHFTLRISAKACKHNIPRAVTVITGIIFLPIIAFLLFMTGSILFSDSGEISGIDAVFTFLPSIIPVVVAWLSKEHLFRKLDQFEDDDETNGAEEMSDVVSGSTNGGPNSVPSHSTNDTNETKPLLNKPTIP